MKKLLFLVIGAICAIHLVAQTTYTVSPSGTNSGTSWTTIKAAMNVAASGDIIEVAAGTFTENTITWSLKDVTIKGAGMNSTIIDGGNGNVTLFKFDGAYTASNTITIQDLTLQNALRTGNAGGAIRFVNSSANSSVPTLNLTNLKIANNSANGGGGVYTVGVTLNIRGCYITGNTQTGNSTGFGGGICANGLAGTGVNVTIKNSTISNNTCTSTGGNGGGVAVVCAANGSTAVTNSLTIENSTIYNNTLQTSGKSGAGVYFKTITTQTTAPVNNLTLKYCTIANNTTTSGGGADGIAVYYTTGICPTTLVMHNSIVMGNSGSASNPAQIGSISTNTNTLLAITANPTITNSIFGIINGGTWVTATNTFNNNTTAVIGDLAFDAALSPDAVPVLKIGTYSIAKDYVASNNQLASITTDELGFTRDAKPDAGAYENPDISTLLQSLQVDGKEVEFFKAQTLHYNCYQPYTYNVQNIPQVTYTAGAPTQVVNVQQASSMTGSEAERTTTITVTAGEKTAVYTVMHEIVPKLDIYLCLGQSNMSGYGAILDQDNGVINNTFLLTPDKNFEHATNPLNRYATMYNDVFRISPAYGFSLGLQGHSANSVGLIVNARIGSSIANWAKGNDSTKLYSNTVARALAAKQWGDIKGIIWHQGESNSSDTGYMTKLQTLVANFRADIGIPDLFFVAGELGYWRGGGAGSTAFNNNIRTISSYITNAHWVSAEGLTYYLNDTDPHFSRESAITLGGRYAEKVIAHNYTTNTVETLNVTPFQFTLKERCLTVVNETGTRIAIYDILGKILFDSTDSTFSYIFPSAGIFFLTDKSRIQKIISK